jgi:hypothetical protein
MAPGRKAIAPLAVQPVEEVAEATACDLDAHRTERAEMSLMTE